ncbi:hypothetical protein Bequi_12290 [Brachybacterium sp. JHP9]|uniref:NlpC/P60 domain-containing protein n=1 Tax=Brachybacterium equifaecis TaxID=2910770 RepID=A0ABT0R2I8_9MICO|nr:hypothetical protein [Brachybacterium equifaecis]MCL6424147.1 hypothetical protein [Brachybacterium equifaecis]
MPATQPFRVPADIAESSGWAGERARVTAELRDSFELYFCPPEQRIVLLDRAQARELPTAVRAQQPAPHRWPTADPARDLEQTVRRVERRRAPSRHREISAESWTRIGERLPGARGIAGTFPETSGPNCFGAVMAAAGVAGAEAEWMQIEPFERWLVGATEPVRGAAADQEIGTVLVWRTADGQAAHAAITLGEDRLLHKASQGWMSPTVVLSVHEGKMAARYAGLHLSRRRLV